MKAIFAVALLEIAILCASTLAQENTAGYWIERAEELSQNSSFEEPLLHMKRPFRSNLKMQPSGIAWTFELMANR